MDMETDQWFTGTMVEKNQLLQFAIECKEFFTCTVCKDFLIPEVYRCKFGHFVCQTCTTKLMQVTCPMCRDGIQVDIGVSRLLFNSKVTVPCRFGQAGCSENFNLKDVVRHMTQCNFRDVYCQLTTSCIDSGLKYPITELLSHWQEEHAVYVSAQAIQLVQKVPSTISFQIGDRNDEGIWPMTVLKYKKNTLLLCIVMMEGNLTFWMSSTELADLLDITYRGEFLAYNKQNRVLINCGFSGLPVFGIHKHSVAEATESFGVGMVAGDVLKHDNKGALIRQFKDEMEFSIIITIN